MWGVAPGTILVGIGSPLGEPEKVSRPPLPPCEECAESDIVSSIIQIAVTDRTISTDWSLKLYSGSDGPGYVAAEEKELPKDCPVLVCPSAAGWQPNRLFVIHDREKVCGHPRSLRVTTERPPKGAEVVHAYGPLIVYRTAESVRALADWFVANGQVLRSLLWFERAILIRADTTDLGADGDAAWAKYEKLKALALAPGTPAEGEVALRMAVQLARKLAGEES